MSQSYNAGASSTAAQQGFSLLKYDTPVLVQKSIGGKGGGSSISTSASSSSGDMRQNDYLNSILPPREYQDMGQLWVQYVSPTPATRQDVVNLQDELDKKLQERQARETGICPIREELYSQAFDEIIREVTINCAERGFLLVRVRDEIKMTIQAYQTLYESSIAYGMRKALQAEQNKAEMLIKIQDIEENCSDLEDEVDKLKHKINSLLRNEKEDKERAKEQHEQEKESYRSGNLLQMNELKQILLDIKQYQEIEPD